MIILYIDNVEYLSIRYYPWGFLFSKLLGIFLFGVKFIERAHMPIFHKFHLRKIGLLYPMVLHWCHEKNS